MERSFFRAAADGRGRATRDSPIVAGYAEDHELKSACSRYKIFEHGSGEEVNAVRRIVDRSTDIKFLDVLSTKWTERSRKALRLWLGAAKDVIHLNCHTVRGEGVRLRHGAEITIGELAAIEAADLGGSMVFVNACSSALGAGGVAPSVADAFIRMNAEAVACTTGPVEDTFATEFAHAFYAAFRKPETTVATALLSARRQVAQGAGHPLGNLYTVVGDPGAALRLGEGASR